MCNRFAFASSPEELAEMRDTLGLVDPDKELLTPRYNIAPTAQIAVAVARVSESGPRELARMRWGLIPKLAEAGREVPIPHQRPFRDGRDEAIVPHRVQEASVHHSGQWVL
jgi:putative SOS response-associated peptidase YedK